MLLKPIILTANDANVIDFGAVQVNDKSVKIITIDNSGKFPFDFKWDYQRHPNISLSPGILFLLFHSLFFLLSFSLHFSFFFIHSFMILMRDVVIGTVNPEDKVQCEVTFHPTREQELDNYKLTCKVTNGHKFVILFKGKGMKPALDFSFFHYDFGPCFLYRQGNAPKVNKDK